MVSMDFFAVPATRLQILYASAHWATPHPSVGGVEHPGMSCSFYGFPPELYGIQYPAPGDPAMARELSALLAGAGLDAALDASRGLDHGVWVPLSLTFPDAVVPVVPLAMQPQLGAAHDFAIGRDLRRLHRDNVLNLPSGGATHNLRRLSALRSDDTPPQCTAAFEECLGEPISRARVEDLRRWVHLFAA
jgi:4,5-DOPA dioxygenase extradiol